MFLCNWEKVVVMKFKDLVSRFSTYLLTQKRVSKNTYTAYSKDLEQFSDFLENNNIDIDLLSSKVITQFLYYLKQQDIKSRSLARKISSIKAFFSYVHQHTNVPNYAVNISFPKLEKRLPDYLAYDEVILLLEKASEDKTDVGQRNFIMLHLLYATGLRITELVTLKTSAINFETGFIKVDGKGDKQRMIPVPQETLKLLRGYLSTNHKKIIKSLKITDYLFPTVYRGSDKHITRQAFWNILKILVKKTGIEKNISPHKLRHTLATHLLNKGADLRSLQMLLGHEQLGTVQIYTHLDTRGLRKIYNKKHPRS